MIRKKKNTGIRLIKKANKLVESRYKFDIWETRVFLSVLAQITRNDEDFTVYRIWYKDVIKSFDLKSSQSYEFLRNAARGLMRKVFYVTNVEKGKKRETEYHIIRTVNYLAEGEEATDSQDYIDITIDPDMKPLLLQLGSNYKGEKGEDFTAYDLRNVVKLGAYHVRIYELLKQYQSIGKRTIAVEEIKRMLEITNEYPLFGNLFQKVITPSVNAINDHTDLNITKLEKVKRGRRVDALYFEFREKTIEEKRKARGGGGDEKQLPLWLDKDKDKKTSEDSTEDTLFNSYHKTLKESFGVTPSRFLKTLKTDKSINEERIEKAMRVTRRMKAQNGIAKSLAGFFIKALKDDYTDPKEEVRKKRAAEKENKKEINEKIEELKAQKEKKINDRIREVVEENTNIREQAIDKIKTNVFTKRLVKRKEEVLGRTLELEDYRKDAQLRELVKSNIIQLSKERFKDILEEYNKIIKELNK